MSDENTNQLMAELNLTEQELASVRVKPEPKIDHQAEELEAMVKIIEREQLAKKKAEEQAQSFLIRKAQAEAAIKKLTEQKLAKANQIGGMLGLQTFLTHFMMGGTTGAFEDDRFKLHIKIFASPFGLRTGLFCGAYLEALRIEENPAFPVFLLGHGNPMSSEETGIVKSLQDLLSRFMKPYAHATPDTLTKVISIL